MKLTTNQLAEIVKLVAERAVEGWATKSPMEKYNISSDLLSKLRPIFEQLPEGTTSDDLDYMEDFFRQISIDLIVKRMRRVQIYSGISDFKILENISEHFLEKYSRYLLTLTHVALEVNPQGDSLEKILEDFDSIDFNAALSDLLEDDADNP